MQKPCMKLCVRKLLYLLALWEAKRLGRRTWRCHLQKIASLRLAVGMDELE